MGVGVEDVNRVAVAGRKGMASVREPHASAVLSDAKAEKKKQNREKQGGGVYVRKCNQAKLRLIRIPPPIQT